MVSCVFASYATSSAQIKHIAETSEDVIVGGTTLGAYGRFGAPSLSNDGLGGWNLAVRSYPLLNSSIGNRVLFFTNSGSPAGAYVGGNVSSGAGLTDRPSSAFTSVGPAYLDHGDGLVYSGSPILPPLSPLNFFFGSPSGHLGGIAHYEADLSTTPSVPRIVGHVGAGANPISIVSATAGGFFDIGMISPGFTNDISFGRGGGLNIAFRGHHASSPAANGIFVQQFNGPANIQSVVDNTFINPLTAASFTFSPSDPAEMVLPVAHGAGAAWVNAGQGVLARPVLGNGLIHVIDGPTSITNNVTYGNVSSGGAGMLVYEKTPVGEATQIWINLVGKKKLAVDRTMIARRTVLDLSIGSEAVVSNLKPLTFPGAGAYTLGFHAFQNTQQTENAIYIQTIPEFGLDLAGKFGADRLESAAFETTFTVGGGMIAGTPSPESDYITIMGHNNNGRELQISQQYGESLGVDSGADDNPFLLNSTIQAGQMISEGVSIRLEQDAIIDTLLFTHLDVGEVVRYGVDGSFHELIYDDAGHEQYIAGVQGLELQPMFLPAGSRLTIEHGGGGDGFGLSSLIVRAAVPEPSTLANVVYVMAILGIRQRQRHRKANVHA